VIVRCVDQVFSETTNVISPTSGSPFEEFYATEFARTTRLAHLLTGRNDVAEDLAQDAMARIHRHFDGLDNPAAYLRTTVVNVCLGTGIEARSEKSSETTGSQSAIQAPENASVWVAGA
jgi:DNA-directed RNA polymerase specialized sigma24 family protein